jgi:hypothetical protein
MPNDDLPEDDIRVELEKEYPYRHVVQKKSILKKVIRRTVSVFLITVVSPIIVMMVIRPLLHAADMVWTNRNSILSSVGFLDYLYFIRHKTPQTPESQNTPIAVKDDSTDGEDTKAAGEQEKLDLQRLDNGIGHWTNELTCSNPYWQNVFFDYIVGEYPKRAYAPTGYNNGTQVEYKPSQESINHFTKSLSIKSFVTRHHSDNSLQCLYYVHQDMDELRKARTRVFLNNSSFSNVWNFTATDISLDMPNHPLNISPDIEIAFQVLMSDDNENYHYWVVPKPTSEGWMELRAQLP